MPQNLEKYRPYLDDFDMTEKQKDEFIQSLWVIMQSFADQAFGITASQKKCEFPNDKIFSAHPTMVEFNHQSHIIEKAVNDNLQGTTYITGKNKP